MADEQFPAPVVGGLDTDDSGSDSYHVLRERHGPYTRGHKVVWIEGQLHSVPPKAGKLKSGLAAGGGLHARDGIRCLPLKIDDTGVVYDKKAELPALARRFQGGKEDDGYFRSDDSTTLSPYPVHTAPDVKSGTVHGERPDEGRDLLARSVRGFHLLVANAKGVVNNGKAILRNARRGAVDTQADPDTEMLHERSPSLAPPFNHDGKRFKSPTCSVTPDGTVYTRSHLTKRDNHYWANTDTGNKYPLFLENNNLQALPKTIVDSETDGDDIESEPRHISHARAGGVYEPPGIYTEQIYPLFLTNNEFEPPRFPEVDSLFDGVSTHSADSSGRKARAENGIAGILADSLQNAAEQVFPVVAREDGTLHFGGLRKRSDGDPETYRSVRISEGGKLHLGRVRKRADGSTYGLVETDGGGRVHRRDIRKRSAENAGGSVCQVAPGPAPGPVYCPIQADGNGRAHPGRFSRRSGGHLDGKPEIKGGPFYPFPGLAPAFNVEGGSTESSLNATENLETNSTINRGDMARIFHSMSMDNLAVLLPVVMFGTLLLILIVFAMTFCCLRQAEETYNINIKGIENMKHRKRSAKQRRRNGASTGAAEEGQGWAQPGMVQGQAGIDPSSNNRSWFLQRWYTSLRGDSGHKVVSFAPSPEIAPQRSAMKSTPWSRHVDGGHDSGDPRDPSYVLEAVADRLQQQQIARGRPRSLSTIWSDGASAELPGGKAVLVTGRRGSDSVSQGTGRMSRRMHGAKVEAGTAFRQDEGGSAPSAQTSGEGTTPPSTPKTTSGSGSTLTGSGGQGTDPSYSIEPGADFGAATELVSSDPSSELLDEAVLTLGTYRMMIEADLSIPDNLREPREFIRVMRPDLFQSSSETTLESGDANQNGWVEDHGTILRRHSGAKEKGNEEAEVKAEAEAEVEAEVEAEGPSGPPGEGITGRTQLTRPLSLLHEG